MADRLRFRSRINRLVRGPVVPSPRGFAQIDASLARACAALVIFHCHREPIERTVAFLRGGGDDEAAGALAALALLDEGEAAVSSERF